MVSGGTRRSFVFVLVGAAVVAVAVALNVSWILINWRQGLLLVLGIVFFVVIIAGVALNTVFLVREVRRNEQHDAFINAVTHDLKTPVASIRLYLETLQRRDLPPEKRQEFYGTMLEDTDRLLHQIEQVLRAGRLRARRRLFAPTLVDLADTARECVAVARARYHLAEEALTYRDGLPAGARPTVLGDPDELKAAIDNLVDNAIKYSPDGVQVQVEVTALDAARLAVRVRDTGIGISPGELRRVFRRFYRIPAAVALRIKGTGLGLFIVSSVARRHGGRVFAESDGPGRGATFTLQLPAAGRP